MAVCGSCGRENREGRKFCVGCGQSLVVALLRPSCGAPYQPDESFCGDCGAALAAAPAPTPATAAAAPIEAAVAERRLVTVLFADLVGFTTLSESRDPEEVRELLSRYFDTCRRLIGLYGGVVEKFIGDAVMAVWGTPVATEDDAERAVRTALDLVAAVQSLGQEAGIDGLLEATAHRFRARLAGDDPGADRHFTTSAAQLRSLELPFYLAVVQLEHGEWLTARGRPDDAQPLLAEARDTFERLEALPWLERVDVVAPGAAAEVGV